MALLLDLANIAGGFLLAVPLLRRLPKVGEALGVFAGRAAPFGWIVGIVALATGAAYLLMHLLAGRVLHFEVVGIGVGLALLWERLTGRRTPAAPDGTEIPAGAALLLAIFGVVAILVGLQGMVTPN
jgi:hypothetical protein